MEELKVYSVSDEYISYLQQYNSNVYSNKIENRVHTRKYVGVVIRMGNYNYYIPMSSPKSTDYQVAGDIYVRANWNCMIWNKNWMKHIKI